MNTKAQLLAILGIIKSERPDTIKLTAAEAGIYEVLSNLDKEHIGDYIDAHGKTVSVSGTPKSKGVNIEGLARHRDLNKVKDILKAAMGRPMMLNSMTDKDIEWLFDKEFLDKWKERTEDLVDHDLQSESNSNSREDNGETL